MLEQNGFVRDRCLSVAMSYISVADHNTQRITSCFVLATTFSTVKPKCLKISL
jgi:hypothetical protein